MTEEVLAKNGVVLLPLTVHVLSCIFRFYHPILRKSFCIDFVDRSENLLCEVTNMVTDDTLWRCLGISGNQEDEYCNIANASIDQCESLCTDKDKAIFKIIQVKYSDKRFI